MAKGASLEDNFVNIEEILDQLEHGSLSLDESFRLYKDGMKLVKQCGSQLDKIEKQIIILDRQEEEQDDV